jgi:hypothetical protein
MNTLHECKDRSDDRRALDVSAGVEKNRCRSSWRSSIRRLSSTVRLTALIAETVSRASRRTVSAVYIRPRTHLGQEPRAVARRIYPSGELQAWLSIC